VIISGQFIVLDKTPYRESALLLRGISPDYGRISFILHGAQSGKKPLADIFRELEIEFEDREKVQELYTAKKAEVLTDFSPLAEHHKSFVMAGRIAAFLLNNMSAGIAQPYTYDTLRSVLANLALAGSGSEWTLVQCAVVIKTAFLYENGMLPEGTSAAQNEFLENLVASGIDNSPLPECPAKYYDAVNSWLNSLIQYHQLKR
jgi:recombinational DNA repair protein (RecF pathway)